MPLPFAHIRRAATAAICCATLAATACGGDDKPAEPPPGTPGDALTQEQALAFETGTPRDELQREAGRPLPVADYALTAAERRDCTYYAYAGDPPNYDNVWRFCFRDGRLHSVSTAPSRKAAGPDAGEPSPEDPRELLEPGEGGGRLGPAQP